ncbi:hypothetical protein EVAR_56843_1 [Eumeta japonica]|uniref:Uncharacterized protein n=1 Tax=Eumeta variegata TaxID=151549 RepID=A0A4C1ZDW0_EUMVA|nr:hypothetical protein EVAR_56843_1 [Eumeta japonica]
MTKEKDYNFISEITQEKPKEPISKLKEQDGKEKASKEKDIPVSKSTEKGEKDEAWGYDLYPERRGTFKSKFSNVLIGKEGKEPIDKIKCEKNVYDCVKNS